MDHYADAVFAAKPGYEPQCWRFVMTERQGMPTHCPKSVEWHGRNKVGGEWLEMDSCAGHVEGIVGARKVREPRRGLSSL